MFRWSILMIALAALPASSALGRDGYGVDYGHNDNRRHHHHHGNRRGAWIDNNRGHMGAHHGGHFGAGHGRFSPRGQGGYHWGW